MRISERVIALILLVAGILALAGCGGGSTAGPAPVASPDFSLSASPSTLAINVGGSGNFSVTATAVNGFSQPLSVTLTGLPTGVTANPSTLTLTLGVPLSVTLTASSSAAAGNATVTLNATAGSLVHTTTVALSIAAAVPSADFALSASPASLAITAGSTGQLSVTAVALNGFSQPVSATFTGLPAGVTANPSTLTLTPGVPLSVTLSALSTAAAGNATVTLNATAGSLVHTATVALSITAAPLPDFSLTVTPSSQTITAGNSGSPLILLATAMNGFTGNVAVAVTGLPSGVASSPSSLTLTPGVPLSITLTASPSAPVGNATVTLTGSSGSQVHTATVALSIAAVLPPPDFSLSLAPASQSITAGSSGSPLTLTVAAVNGFTANVAVAVSGLPSGVTLSPASLTLTPATPQAVTLTAAASAMIGTATVTFTGTSGSLTHTTTLALTIDPASVPTGPDVTTYHYDNARDGLNAEETVLTLSNVTSASFGLLGVYLVDGRVDAQPLYVGGLSLLTGTQAHTDNVVYVATEHDSVYALNVATGAQEWKTTMLGSGESPSDDHGCYQITPEIGVTATPVIDRAHGPNGAIFVVGMSKDAGGSYHQRLHALDLTTGAELPGSPTEIAATYPGTGANSQGGNVIFAPGQYAERVGLLLINGTIYTAWTSHCDAGPYTGWVMGYSESTLQQSTVLNLTPNGSEGSVWMSGYGLGADASANIYFLGANGTFDNTFTANGFPVSSDYGNAMLKLSTTGGLAVADYFEPYNTVAESGADLDLGSGGAMLLPDLTDNVGAIHHLLVGAGKDGNIYVGNRDNLGKFNRSAQNNANLYQEIAGALPNGAWSGPAYFNSTVYYGGVGDVLKAYTISNAMLNATPASRSLTSFAFPGATPSVSANGTQNAIVWALESATGSPGVLHAYDATNLARELYNSNQAAGGRDAFGSGNKFITPMVANGKVFVGTTNGVAVFGLR